MEQKYGGTTLSDEQEKHYEITTTQDSIIESDDKKQVGIGTKIIVLNVTKISEANGGIKIKFGPSGGRIKIGDQEYINTPSGSRVFIKGCGNVVPQDLEAIILLRLHGKKGDKLTPEQKKLIEKRLTVIESVEPGEKAYTPDDPGLPNLVMEEIKRGYKQIGEETKDVLKESRETGDVLMTSVHNIDTLFADDGRGEFRREELKKFLEDSGYRSFTDVAGEEVKSTLNFKLWEPAYDWLHGDPNYRGEALLFYVFVVNRATGEMTYAQDLYPTLRKDSGGSNLPKTASALIFSLLDFAEKIERGEFLSNNIPIKHAKIIDLSCQSYSPIVHETQFGLIPTQQRAIIVGMIKNCFPKETSTMSDADYNKLLNNIFYTTNHYENANDIGSVAFVEKQQGYIKVHSVCVDKDHRGEGLCDKLMRGIIDKYGAQELRLNVRVTPANRRAWKCYENVGFKLMVSPSTCTPSECQMVRPAGAVFSDYDYKNTFFLDQLYIDNDGKSTMRPSDGYPIKLLKNKGGITKSLWAFCDNRWIFHIG